MTNDVCKKVKDLFVSPPLKVSLCRGCSLVSRVLSVLLTCISTSDHD